MSIMKIICSRAWLALVSLVVLFPMTASAQEAALGGTINDSTGGVLPGVTINAVHQATGNTFVGVTDEKGAFRMPVRTGDFTVTLELQGFATVTRTMSLLVGQTGVLNVQMTPATLQESVTVSGQAPLVDTTSSSLGGNVDRRQMADLPLNGRNFVDLTMLAAGSRQNTSSDELGGLGTFQINLDGLRVTQNQTAGFGQPKYSRDSIAEFEFVSNRFDATQGGSIGAVVNAITKSGTNTFAGTFSGYFRDSQFKAADFVQHRVLPYEDQQISTTFGGPILRNRIHFFANYEYEREPQTYSFSSPYPAFNIDLIGTRTEPKGGGRVDFQFNSQAHMTIRGSQSLNDMPYDSRYTGGDTKHPSSAIATSRHSKDLTGVFTQILSSQAVNELRAGYAQFYWLQDSILSWANHPYPGLTRGTPIIQLRNYTIGQGHTNSHEDERQYTYTVKDNLTVSFDKGGRHDVKLGGEAGYQDNPVFLCNRCMGILDAQGGAIPSNIQSLFPVWNDISTWNIAALSPTARSYIIGVGDMSASAPLHMFSGWIQDDWHPTNRLTLNLGLRYDLETGLWADDVSLEPFLHAGRKEDTNDWGPRTGFAYSLTKKTVLRGGFGKYFSDPGSWLAYWTHLTTQAVHPQVLNDGRSDFASNPFNGPIPTYDQVLQTLCTVSSAPNCLRRSVGTLAANSNEVPYSYQSSVGVQRQIGDAISLEADYIRVANRAMLKALDVNLAFNPATGLNYAFTDVSKRPYSQWGTVQQQFSIGESNSDALQIGVTKRMSNHWQASATYLLYGQRNLQNSPALPGCQYVTTLNAAGQPVCDVPVTLNPVIQEEWYQTGDQRNRVTFSGIVDLPFGMQMSGLYLYGDQGWGTSGSGVDALATGTSSASTSRLRSNGSLIARNDVKYPALHRVDMRMQKRITLHNNVSIEGIVEAFNVFNHANYGSFTLVETSPNYRKPTDNTNIAFQPRTLQFGFRTTF
jgi:Carboxypeptidase regulatory-like domain/TonB dependent receptor-like, beta-barrel